MLGSDTACTDVRSKYRVPTCELGDLNLMLLKEEQVVYICKMKNPD